MLTKFSSLLFLYSLFAFGSGGGFTGGGGVSSGPTLSNPTLTSPVLRQIFQRTSNSAGPVTIAGSYLGHYTSVQAKATVVNGGVAKDWTNVVSSFAGTPFSGTLSLAPGWYSIQVRVVDGAAFSSGTSVAKVGLGELFIVAGQSLVANGGQTVNTTNDDRVNAVNLSNNWQLANDPQPVATSAGGSPTPLIGNALVARLNMPVGFCTVAQGGTTSASWETTNYTTYLKPAMVQFGNTGFRAIIWEQGQQDGANGVLTAAYEANMTTIINQSRSDAGWTIPWGIADQSTEQALTLYPQIAAAQDFLVAGSIASVFRGSNSDNIVPDIDRYDGTHFNTAGQIIQSNAWIAAIEAYFGW